MSLQCCIPLLLLLATVDGQVMPTIVTPSGQTLRSVVGGIVSLSCEVQNLTDHKVNWVFVKHSTTIFHGDKLMVDDSRYSLAHPPESNVYSLQITFAEEGDQGVYRCEIDGTKLAVTMELELEGAPVSPDIESTGKPLNHTSCCQQRGVSEACLPVCYPSSVSGTASYMAACESELTDLIYCGTDGRNHEDCCARSGVPAGCLLFCSFHEEKLDDLSSDELVCLNHTDAIISCYEYGAALLPSPPRAFSVISVSRNGSYSLRLSWKPPRYNPSAVSGYIVHYKQFADSKFMATGKLNAAVDTYSLPAVVNTKYSVYVVAIGSHGSSQPTNVIDIVVQDTSPPGHAKNVLLCCEVRQVPPRCQNTLCHPRVWAEFNATEMIECYGYLPDVFSCLAGEADHSGCCRTNNVAEECLGMCSGQPPVFNQSLAGCIPKLAIMEACVQSGLSSQPQAPQGMAVMEVGVHTALITWAHPSTTADSPVEDYYVQLRRGDENAPWLTMAQVTETWVELTNLTETENYALRVIANTVNGSSLPSAVVHFTTYPEMDAVERPTVVHNFTECCEDSGMPAQCSAGCRYLSNVTAYYITVFSTCEDYIGTVLTCAADGRDHTPCCRQDGVQEACYDLCSHSTPGALDYSYLVCIMDTSKIVMCFQEGLENLVRTPEDVEVTNLTSHTVSIQWKNPDTGPQPQKYQVVYTNLNSDINVKVKTTELRYILQNLVPRTPYSITVTSLLNDTSSPPTDPITVFTPELEWEFPFNPAPPSNTSRALWTNRTHCCQSSGISPACQPVCLNRPAPNTTDCTTQNHNILICAADGKDHTLCCQENGLPQECLPLCGSHSATNFSVQLAGCLADASMSIITSCFLSYSGLLPSVPYQFRAWNAYGSRVILQWSRATNCDPNLGSCSYDVHYWPANNTDPSAYTTVWGVMSPYNVTTLMPGQRYTFTVTARNSKGSGSAAPWVTLFFGDLVPDVSIAQSPKQRVFEQGSTVFLTCDAYNLRDAPTFIWRLRSRQLSTRGRVLKLTNVNQRSEGNYSCTVTAGNFSVTAETYVNVRYKPDFVYFRTDTVRPNVSQEAVMACWFRGHPNTSNPVQVWTKDRKPLRRSSRVSVTVKSRYHTGITAFKVKIASVVASDYGMYQCNVSNQYGPGSAHTKLIDPAKVLPPVTATPLQERNVSNCCRAKGVIDTCMPLCTYEVSVEEAIERPDKYGFCLLFISELIECAADGADHSLCCVDKVVPDVCLPFCKGEAPSISSLNNNPDLLQCVPEAATILDCMDRGYEKIPTAPRHLVASFQGNKIKLAWEAPSRNADRVTSYNMYYNFTGNSAIQTETITSFVGFNHVLVNMDPDHIYYIWMTAETYKFGMSQISKIVAISVNGELPMPPTGVKVRSLSGTTVVISWELSSRGSIPSDSFAVYYKPRNAVKEEMKVTVEKEATLTGLKQYTQYVVSVTSRSVAVESQRLSPLIFTTGPDDGLRPRPDQQGGEEGLGGGEIAGIVLAVVVVVAVGCLLAMLIYRSHSGKKKLKESVSFENPSYGNQQVHIGGLPTNNPCDNVMEPHTQPENDGSFNYAHLQEDAAAAAYSTARPVSEMDLPSTEYTAPAADPSGISVDVGSNGVTTLQESGTDLQSESTT